MQKTKGCLKIGVRRTWHFWFRRRIEFGSACTSQTLEQFWRGDWEILVGNAYFPTHNLALDGKCVWEMRIFLNYSCPAHNS